MECRIGASIKIKNPSTEIMKWVNNNLKITNPEYIKKMRMGFWTGNTPQIINLYSTDGDWLILPYGVLSRIIKMLPDDVVSEFKEPEILDIKGEVDLYDYQENAVNRMILNHSGILQSPAGSGKTQMGIAIAAKLRKRTLWLTHTKDLLTQSKQRAEKYFDPSYFGTITEGKVNIGKWMTFATVQTMCNLDLSLYEDTFDVIIVDECHRVAGTPTAVSQFSKVLSHLKARNKYGLSATVHRADGMIEATYSLLGMVVHEVPPEEVASKVMQVTVYPRGTKVMLNRSCTNTDGTINYAKMITYLTNCKERNNMILTELRTGKHRYNLILSERLDHLMYLHDRLKASVTEEYQDQIALISGQMTSKKDKARREQILEDMRDGKIRWLFATYKLAKEGLDIPRLDRLYLTTPQTDYAVIVQSVGRVARVFEGKPDPEVYDYVDKSRNLVKAYKKRCTSYRKCGCQIEAEIESYAGLTNINNAIVRQACEDYLSIKTFTWTVSSQEHGHYDMDELMSFFRSEYYVSLTKIPYEGLIRMMDDYAELMDYVQYVPINVGRKWFIRDRITDKILDENEEFNSILEARTKCAELMGIEYRWYMRICKRDHLL